MSGSSGGRIGGGFHFAALEKVRQLLLPFIGINHAIRLAAHQEIKTAWHLLFTCMAAEGERLPRLTPFNITPDEGWSKCHHYDQSPQLLLSHAAWYSPFG
jgi:hypothetical protein